MEILNISEQNKLPTFVFSCAGDYSVKYTLHNSKGITEDKQGRDQVGMQLLHFLQILSSIIFCIL